MTIVKFKSNNGFSPFNYVPAGMHDLFNDFMNGDLISRDVFKSVPSVNISETKDHYLVEMAVPGLKKEDFKIHVENEVLSISADRKVERQEENTRFTRKEFSYTSFSRSFRMPEGVNPDLIQATYNHGVLSLTLQKQDDSKKNPVHEIRVS